MPGKVKEWIGKIMKKIPGMKITQRMIAIYLIGGALPMIAIGMYLISGTRQILVDQVETAEITELELSRRRMEELLSTVEMVSKYFLFDEKLEDIAAKDYTNYQEMVDDFRNYGAFTEYGQFYNNLIEWISIYLDNDSLRGNFHLVRVDDSIRDEAWYQNALALNGVGKWQYIRRLNSFRGEKGLALTKLLKTEKGQNVGVLVIHVREGRLSEILEDRIGESMLVLNGTDLLTEKKGNHLELSKIQPYLPEKDNETHQQKVTIDAEEYVMTCANICPSDTTDMITLVSLRSYGEILSRANEQNRRSMIMFVCFTAGSIVMIFIFCRSFGNRVGRFHREMQKAAMGNFDLVKDLGGNDEISELYSYLGTMIYEIQKLLSEIYQEKIHAEELRSEQKEAEFQMLASQINPHFLYNTLETIRMTARVHKEYDIERLVKMLARILRSSIRSGGGDVTIQTEIELIECYLEIQKYRFGDRIQYEIEVDPDLREKQVLPLLMQPLVENSIIHGLEIKEGVGHIRISVQKYKDDRICITIADDGVGMEEEKLHTLRSDMSNRWKENKHIGVGNVCRRLRLRYGEPYGLEIDSRPGEGTYVKIYLPREEKI